VSGASSPLATCFVFALDARFAIMSSIQHGLALVRA
jgi:hypothetical protein